MPGTKSRKLVEEVPQIFLLMNHEVNKVKLDFSVRKEGVEEQRKLEVSIGYFKEKLQS